MFKSKENKEIDALDALEIKRNGDILFEESEYYTGGEGIYYLSKLYKIFLKL